MMRKAFEESQKLNQTKREGEKGCFTI